VALLVLVVRLPDTGAGVATASEAAHGIFAELLAHQGCCCCHACVLVFVCRTVIFLWLNTLDPRQNAVSVGKCQPAAKAALRNGLWGAQIARKCNKMQRSHG
jgi:hypothetical protein